MRVWREGDRIRNERGTGYADRVPDSDIVRHVRDETEWGDPTEFGLLTLGLRAYERAVEGGDGG